MALTGKYVGIGRIIEGLFRDYGWTHEVEWVDAMEWIGEAMDLIAAPKQYTEKVTDGNEAIGHPCPIQIKKYRGELPCGLVQITQVRENKTKIPMRYSQDNFHRGLEKFEANLPEQDLSWFGNISFNSPFIAKSNLLKDNCGTELSYNLSDCYIFTNFEEGEVEMSYKSLTVDEDGYPMVPDNIKYTQAVKAYVAEKIGQKLWLQNKLTADKFNFLQRERDWYIGAATSAGLMPSTDEMESWKNQFLRLIPILDSHRTSFKYIGDPAKQRTINSF